MLNRLRKALHRVSRRKIEVIDEHWDFLTKSRQKVLASMGGAGSGKSHTVAQHLVLNKFARERDIGILVTRKTFPSLRVSCFRLIRSLLVKYKIPHRLNKATLEISHPSLGNTITFRPLDDVEKIKSIEQVNYVWIEEATETRKDDYIQLQLRLRAPNKNFTQMPLPSHKLPPAHVLNLHPEARCYPSKNQIYLTFNPTDPNSYLKKLTDSPDSNTRVLRTTFRNNPFLHPDYVEYLESLVEEDQAYYKIYNLGDWAVIANLVYPASSWTIVPNDFWPRRAHPVSHLDPVNPLTGELYSHWFHGFGLDFGYAHSKVAIVEAWVNMLPKPPAVYLRLHTYEPGLTTSDIIGRLDDILDETTAPSARNSLIIADSARPDNIEEIRRAGYNIKGCIKGKGSVKTGIDRVKRVKTHILHDSLPLATEKTTYKWKKNKAGDVLGEVMKFKDDGMDSERYIVSELLKFEWMRSDMKGYGTVEQIPEEERKKLEAKLSIDERNDAVIKEARWFRDMIAYLPRAAKLGKEVMRDTCRDIMRNAGPPGTVTHEALEHALEEKLHPDYGTPDPLVRFKCEEMLDILQTRCHLKIPSRKRSG